MARNNKRKPLNNVDGNRLVVRAGKSLRRNHTMDHQDDNAYDFLSTASSSTAATATTATSLAVNSRGSWKRPRTADTFKMMIDSDTKTPRISNTSAADRARMAGVASWALPPRPPVHNTSLTVMSAATAATVYNATSTSAANASASANPRSLSPTQQSRHANALDRAASDPVARPTDGPTAAAAVAAVLTTKVVSAAYSRMNRSDTSPSIPSEAINKDKDSQQQRRSTPESLVPSGLSLLQDKDADDDMDTDSDNDSLGVESPNSVSLDTATTTKPRPQQSTSKVALAIREGLQTSTTLQLQSLTLSSQELGTKVAQLLPAWELPVKVPRWLHRSAPKNQAVFPPVVTATAAAATNSNNNNNSNDQNDSKETPAARVVLPVPNVATAALRSAKAPLEEQREKQKTSPILREALELARQRMSVNQEQRRRVSQASVLEMNAALLLAPVQRTSGVSKSGVPKSSDGLLRARPLRPLSIGKKHSPSMLEQIEDSATQLIRPLSRNVLEKYRRSPADNQDVVQAMLMSGNPPAMRTPDSITNRAKALIGTTVKLERCSSFDGSEMTMEDLPQHIPRTKALPKPHWRKRQTAQRSQEVLLNNAHEITEEMIPPVGTVQPANKTSQGPTSSPTETPTKSPPFEEQTNQEAWEVASLDLQHRDHRRDHRSPELWTAEAAGHMNHAPIFELRGRVLYRHPPMPPGWVLGVSRSKNKPYYYHPDFGTSFYAPVVLPSTNAGSLAAPTRVTRPPEQSIGTFSVSGWETARSQAFKRANLANTMASQGSGISHDERPGQGLQSASACKFDTPPEPIRASVRKLFSLSMQHSQGARATTATAADNSNTAVSSNSNVLRSQTSPTAVDDFSPDSQTLPMPMEIQDPVAIVKQTRRNQGSVALTAMEALSAFASHKSFQETPTSPAVSQGGYIMDSTARLDESELAAEEAHKKLQAEERLGLGYAGSPEAGVRVRSIVPSDDSEDSLLDETAQATPTNVIVTVAGDSSFPINDDDSPIVYGVNDSPLLPSGSDATSLASSRAAHGGATPSISDNSPPFPDNDGPDSPTQNASRLGFGSNLTPHLNAQAGQPSSNFSPVFVRTNDSASMISNLGNDGVSYHGISQGGTSRENIVKPSSVISHAQSFEDDVSLLGGDGISILDTGHHSVTSQSVHSRHSKDSGGSSLVSHMSYRVLHPPMPVCVLQRLDSLQTAKKCKRKKKKNKAQHDKRYSPTAPHDVVDSLGAFS